MASDLGRDGLPVEASAVRAGLEEAPIVRAGRNGHDAPRPATEAASHDEPVAAALVHDLNNLLTVVLGSLEQLRRQPLDGRGQQQLERAEWAAWRAGQVAQEVLAAAAATRPAAW